MNYETIKPFLAAAVRHGLTTFAGILVAHGYMQSSGTEQFIGAGMVFAGVAWSWWQKGGQQQLVADVANLRALLAAKAKVAQQPAAMSKPIDSAAKPVAALALAIGLGLMLAMVASGGSAHAQQLQFKAPQDVIADIRAKLGALPNIQSQLTDIKAGLPPIKPPSQVQADLEAALTAIEQVGVADLDDAVKVFDAAKNYSGKDCFGALRDVIAANVVANQATPLTDAPAQRSAADLPFKHIFLAIAKLYNVMVANQPGGPIRKQCAAMKDDFANSGPGSLLLGSSGFSKVLPILKIIGLGA